MSAIYARSLQGKTNKNKNKNKNINMMKADGSIKVVMCDHQAVVLRNFVVETEIF
jgi:hypothetical protein